MVKTNEESSDGKCWGMTINGQFTVKSTYSATLHFQNSLTNGIWKRIWKMEIPQKVKIFLRLIYHGKILTSWGMMRRGFMTNPHCHICIEEVEDLDHIFQNYNQSKSF